MRARVAKAPPGWQPAKMNAATGFDPRALPIELDLDAIQLFCRKHGLRKLSLFGSVVRDDFDPARSDVDVLAEYLPERLVGWDIIDHQDELSRIVGRPVDYCTRLNKFIWPSVKDEMVTLYEQT